MKNRYNVLFLCTGNSARSIMAEAILRQKGVPRFGAYSAGSRPTGFIRPEALMQLQTEHLSVEGLRSKTWDEFAKPASPQMDFVVTVCDNAAHEACPLWPGRPVTANWGIPDPAAAQGTQDEIARAFRDAFVKLDRRISQLLALPLEVLSRQEIQKEVERIGKE